MLRILLFIHRYLAVVVGLLMALWCLSGFVMIYQPYPEFTAAERLAALAPLQLQGCCKTDFLPGDEAPAGSFRIEMFNGRPVLRRPNVVPIDLASGTPLRRLPQEEVLRVASDYGTQLGLHVQPRWLEEVRVDQWSIQSAGRNQPAQHVALDDAAGTELYINGRTGEIFQQTTRRERVLSWFGAVPHWLYPTVLRRNGPLWSQVVIWTSVIGTFLTFTGLYVGISRLRRRRSASASVSPFRGWWYWHHITGLVFGVLTLTWVFSGLLTMNPWGLLEGSEVGAQLQPRLAGEPPVAELRQFLQGVPGLRSGEYTQLRARPFGGRLFVLAYRADGSVDRLDAMARPAPLALQDVQQVLAGLDTHLASVDTLADGDVYYYARGDAVELPVYRATLEDAQHTRVYIGAKTGNFRIVDRDARQARWLEDGLHGLDFPGLQRRPLWDIIVLLLLAGVTASCITGGWMAIQRIRRDFGWDRRFPPADSAAKK
ncbi:MAG: PepSY domain-containing protein [Pseudomonadota bacterium]